MVKTMISKRQRRKDIDINNLKLLDALQESHTITFQDNKIPRSRSGRSNAIILAQQYGGNKFKRATSALISIEEKKDSPSNKKLKNAIQGVTIENLSEGTHAAEKQQAGITMTQRPLASQGKKQEEAKLRKIASQPAIRIATLVKNSSGVHMSYRGKGCLPQV